MSEEWISQLAKETNEKIAEMVYSEALKMLKPLASEIEDQDKTITRLKSLLREVEWSVEFEGGSYCPNCYMNKIKGHASDCCLAAELKG